MEKKRIAAAVMSVMMLAGTAVVPENYIPSFVGSPAYVSAAVTLSDAEYQRGLHIYEYLKKNTTWNDAAICGILAHLYQESRYLPTATNKESGAYGIAQWLGTRKTQLLKLSNYNTVDVQLKFLVNELNNSADFKMSRTAIQSATNDAAGAYKVAYNVRLNFGWGHFSESQAPAAHKTDSQNIANNAKTVFFPKFSKNITIAVTFHRNINSSDTVSVKESFTTGVTNQKFGYTPDGKGRYSTMNPADVGFGQWSRPGYDMLGWSFDKGATEKRYNTYSGVNDSWITNNSPATDLYAVWAPSKPSWTVYAFKGTGTKADPYQISSAEELVEMQKAVNNPYYTSSYRNAYYVQTEDIDLTCIDWKPIGSYYESETSTRKGVTDFNGVYDGNGHWITGMNVKSADRDYCGLFGRINANAYIHDLGVTGTVNAVNKCAGGIVGECVMGRIENCSFTGMVDGHSHVGGIVGKILHGGTVKGCYANAEIGSTNAEGIDYGGIAGLVKTADASNAANAVVENCYFTGNVNSSISTTGGISGEVILGTTNTAKAVLSNCYALEGSASDAVNSGSMSGCRMLSESMLKNVHELCGSVFVKNNGTQNGGYPVFEWQLMEEAPEVVSQPVSVTKNAGETALFTAAASGNSLSYQWYWRKNSSGTWAASTGTGYNTDTLTVAAETKRNGYQYYCKITDASGKTVKTDIVTLTVKETAAPLTVTSQPADRTVTEGAEAKFTAAASGTGLKYQWYWRKNSSGTWAASTGTGYNTNTLTVAGEAKRNGYQYYCKITDASGNTVKTNTVTLTVKAAAAPLAVTSQPVSTAVTEGAEAKFTVAASGTGLKYQWYWKKPSAIDWSASTGTGCNTNTLTVAGEAKRNGYQYYCKITDAIGKTVSTSAVTLTVNAAAAPLTVTAQPVNTTVAEGATAKFTVSATGTGLKYQWYWKKPSAVEWSASTGTGCDTNTLSVAGEAKRNGYQYYCAVTDASGKTVTTPAVTLTVK